MTKPATATLLLDFKQTQKLAAIFRLAVGSEARGSISYRDGFVQARVHHGIDLKDVAVFTYDAPGHAVRPARASLVKTYQTFNPATRGNSYTFGIHATMTPDGPVIIDHDGHQNYIAGGPDARPMHAQEKREMALRLAEYATLHRDALTMHAAREKETPPKPGASHPRLILSRASLSADF